jgi:hypothetical protein
MMIGTEEIFLNIQFLLSTQLSRQPFSINLFKPAPHFLNFFVQFLSRLGDNLPQRCINRPARLGKTQKREAFYDLRNFLDDKVIYERYGNHENQRFVWPI